MVQKKQEKLLPWGLDISAMFIGDLSGNKAADIHKLLENSMVREALLKSSVKKLQIILDNPDSLPEELEAAAKEVEKYQGIDYKAPLNIIWKDNQTLGSDDKPLPVIAQHFILASVRDTAADSYHDQYGLATAAERKGKVGRQHLRKYIYVYPHHIFLYKDPDHKNLFESKDIVIEGQQPVGQAVKGFAQYEVLRAPIYFSFKIIFHPEGKFPQLADEDLVSKVLVQATLRGLGGRRAANYGQWKILEAKRISFSTPFKIIDGGEDDGRISTVISEAQQAIRKTA